MKPLAGASTVNGPIAALRAVTLPPAAPIARTTSLVAAPAWARTRDSVWSPVVPDPSAAAGMPNRMPPISETAAIDACVRLRDRAMGAFLLRPPGHAERAEPGPAGFAYTGVSISSVEAALCPDLGPANRDSRRSAAGRTERLTTRAPNTHVTRPRAQRA